MRKKIFSLLTGIITTCSAISAQYADLMSDNNISWVAEYTADFTLDPVSCDFSNFDFNNELNVIQLSNSPTQSGLYRGQFLSKYFSQKLFGDMERGTYSFFEDELLEMPLPKEKMLERLSAVDTVVTFDPETYEEAITIVPNEISWENMLAFRVRQVFYYNKSEKTFGSRLLAIAPLKVVRESEETFYEALKTVVWLKIDPPKNPDKISAKDVSYSFETKMKGNAPGLQDFVVKKGRMDFLQLIVNEVTKPSRPILNGDFDPIDPAKLPDYVQSTDTVITYDMTTFAEQIQIVERNAIKDVAAISFVQHWFYDSTKRLFFNRVVAVAPELAVKDFDGNFRYSKVLFYMMNK